MLCCVVCTLCCVVEEGFVLRFGEASTVVVVQCPNLLFQIGRAHV